MCHSQLYVCGRADVTAARLQPDTFWSGGKVEVVSIELSGNRCDQGLRPEHTASPGKA